MLVLAIELLFLLLFVHALTLFLRRRDPLAGDVTLVFSAMAGLFILTLLGAVLDETPRVLRAAAIALLLAQPLLTLRLISHVRDIPRAVLAVAALLFVISTVPLLLREPDGPRWPVWFAVGAFALVEGVVAGYFLGESRARTGAPRLRLRVAALSTALFAGALLMAGLLQGGDAARIVTLLSGVGYVAAFMPPPQLRRLWAMTAAHDYGRELLSMSAEATGRDIWHQFAVSADEICDVDAVVVLARTRDGGISTVASSGLDLGRVTPLERVEFGQLAEPTLQRAVNGDCPVERTFAAAVGARFGTRVPLSHRRGGEPAHIALLLSRHRSLFSADDLEVVAGLGAQAALLAGRAEASAEQERLADQLAATVDALGVASNAKSDLLARVSHEFRTPLTVIIGYCEILRRAVSSGRSIMATDALDRIGDAGQHLITLVDDVLNVAEMDAGHLRLRPEPVDLAELISRAVEELRPVAEHKGVALTVDLAAASVYADPVRLRQVIYNLSSNAIKYTPEGGSVQFVSEQADDGIRISVVDTGIGISPEDQDRVFEDFTQLDEHAGEGSGLGLSIARRLVTAHGGRTELSSRPGEGSRFTVVLPYPA
ncbi:MAG: sensor histidine kinase [Nocardioidaceae bacterium]